MAQELLGKRLWDGLGSSTVFSESSNSWATGVPDLVSTVLVAE